ncbi:sensor histidine kinase [Labedaea rhizosphaerae]|uniref:sensor histidine kinase n=1 Tax=Labedaea rhizosphaerae TaxID=598644 RepID=UPI0014151F7B|nr:histidine kinase [Labedaea rhizosphaerae]
MEISPSRWPAPGWALALLVAMLAVPALSGLPGWALTGALSAPILATVLLPRFPVGSLGVCVAGAVATAPALDRAVPPWTVAFGLALALVSLLAGRRLDRAGAALVVFAAGAVVALVLAFVVAEVWATGLVVLALAVVAPWGIGRAIRQQAELAAAIAERVHLRERTRIAHDMHDTLGHELSLLALRAGALEVSADLGDRHRAAVAELRAGAAATTDVLSDIIRVLRDGEPAPLHPVADHVDDLVARAADAGVDVTLEWTGPRRLPPRVDQTAHRVVQEALTNAVKHAQGSAVRVRVAVQDVATVISVTNAVKPGARRGAGGRLGLVALRERVRLAGGTLEAGPRDREFHLVATLPHAEAS